MNELKACLKCGSEDARALCYDDPQDVVWLAKCCNCGQQSYGYCTEAAAIEAWNARVPDPRLMRAIEEIERCCNTEYVEGSEIASYKAAVSIIHEHLPETKESK